MGYLKQTAVYSLITIAVIVVGVLIFRGGDFSIEKPQPENAMVYPKFKKVADFSFQSGDTEIDQTIFKDKWTMVFFGFTYCPDICPTTMASMRDFYVELPEKLQEKTQILLVSVDPERDNPEQLKNYVEAFHPDFIGMTSNHDNLKKLAANFGVVYYKVGEGDDYLVDHTGKIFLIDPKGQRHAIFDKTFDESNPQAGFYFDVPQMVEDYKIIVES